MGVMSNEPAAGPSDRDFVQSIERGFAVLLAFDADLPTPTLAELATATGYSRPAVRRILLTLQRLGYVASTGSRWTLTPRVLTIGQHFAATHGVVEVAQPHLLHLAEATQESASLAQLDDLQVVYVARVQVRRVMRISIDVGSRVPIHATSMGRVLLAWAGADLVERVIASGLPQLTRTTVTDPVGFRNVLHDVRRLGFAVVDSELEDGLLSAAVPVHDAQGDVLAALAYSTSVGRKSPDDIVAEIIPLMQEAATGITRDLTSLRNAGPTISPQARDGFF